MKHHFPLLLLTTVCHAAVLPNAPPASNNGSALCKHPVELERCSRNLIDAFLDIVYPVHTPVNATIMRFCR